MIAGTPPLSYPHRHLLGIEGLSPDEITLLLDRSESYVEHDRQIDKKRSLLRGRTIINLFFENSTRTRTSFELAGKRLGGDVINMSVQASSIKKGETLIDTAMTLTAMHPDVLVVRHPESGAVQLLAEKVDCAVINAGDGSHEHPTQALLDALTIRRRKGRLQGLLVAICGDILHSRVARSNAMLLPRLGAKVTLCGPEKLLPKEALELCEGVEIERDLDIALCRAGNGTAVAMMLRIQRERLAGLELDLADYISRYQLNAERLAATAPKALVMHPGPMIRGLEISGELADSQQSAIEEQVRHGLAIRSALLARALQAGDFESGVA
jgi:aspartate carbamoyltransferase catalytic subunit